MKYVPNAAQMKAADQYTICSLNVPSLELMERAAVSCVDVIYDKKMDTSDICVLCGSGNNGGDGFAIARILKKAGHKVVAIMLGNPERCTKETQYQMECYQEIGGCIEYEYIDNSYSLIIDAVFGVGLSRAISGAYYNIIEEVNASKAVKLSVDIPSGISADNGQVLGIAFKTDYTVTFQALKTGLLLYPGKEYAGEVIVKNIGISEQYFEDDSNVALIYDKDDYKKMLPVRKENSHKGSYGKLLIIAGCKGMSGAAFLNSISAYTSGAGLVQIYTVEENRIILQQLIPEAIIKTYEYYNEREVKELLLWADAVCIGSGIGTSDVSRKILKTTVEEAQVPCVIDADGLNLLAGHLWYLRKSKCKLFVFTPHMKEMSRLTETDIKDIIQNRFSVIKDFTTLHQVTCILKDARTLIQSPDDRCCINLTGNSSMAKAGSGDVLTGIIGGLLAQGISVKEAAALGVYLHGKSGDFARMEKGSYSVLARDLVTQLAMVLKEEER